MARAGRRKAGSGRAHLPRAARWRARRQQRRCVRRPRTRGRALPGARDHRRHHPRVEYPEHRGDERPWDRLCERSRDEHLDGEDGGPEQCTRRYARSPGGQGARPARPSPRLRPRATAAGGEGRQAVRSTRQSATSQPIPSASDIEAYRCPRCRLAGQPHEHDNEEAGVSVAATTATIAARYEGRG